MILDIKTNLEKEILNPTKKNQFERKHIFYDIKNVVINNSNKENTIDLYYCFSLYEKNLSLCRTNNLDLAAFWISKVDVAHSQLSNDLFQHLKLLYLPMVAFYHYKRKNYSLALNLLSDEILQAYSILRDNENLRLSITFEQIINKYRVLFAAKDYQTALSLAIDSINCIVNNKPFKDVYKVEMKSIIEEGYTEYLQWADYIINSIIERIIHDKELSEFEKNNMIYHVFKNVEQVENKKFFYLNMAKQNIEYFIKNKKSEFIESSYNLSKNISSLPAGVQFFFLYSLDKNNIINRKLHDEYIEKVLKLAV